MGVTAREKRGREWLSDRTGLSLWTWRPWDPPRCIFSRRKKKGKLFKMESARCPPFSAGVLLLRAGAPPLGPASPIQHCMGAAAAPGALGALENAEPGSRDQEVKEEPS